MEEQMRIGILGTGNVAAALGEGWTRAGHEVVVGGRSPEKAAAVAEQIGATAGTLREAATGRDAVLLAVPWEAVTEVLADTADVLVGTPLIDPTNAVRHGEGVLLPADSAARRIAELAPGAHVVKAFHLFPAAQWVKQEEPVVVAMCGDDERALAVVGGLVADVGARPAVLGSLERVRQLEEVAGFVIGLAFQGVDPNAAIPKVG
ncbi:NAD(P)-binding domain-containing protein [Actinokineospora sp. NBRC 105648]|uniref:NADPH-dependent F420 reductase n=1 Tax=Actinokineospora sp. NBRC 105648 TaxID=3032206 RepID=UPI002553B55F|nr:NAD(P)-binding domain-containing protein [Actinokineospora sp. NBRC 105648]